MIAALVAQFAPYLVAAGALIGGLFIAFSRGRASKSAEVKAQQAQDYTDTRKRIDNAISPDLDADAARVALDQRLRDHQRP